MGLVLDTRAEVNHMLREISILTIWGLSEPDIRVKQFYFERIFISLGMSLKDARERLGLEEGIMPDNYDHVSRTLEAKE